MEAHGEWGAHLLRELEAVQRSSWGFSVPPRLGLHVVIVARLGSEAVSSAYLNWLNANVDYGVHVARRLRRWGRGHCTRRPRSPEGSGMAR